MGTHILTPELRDELKKPLGQLIKGTVKEVAETISRVIGELGPSKIITVGDIISRSLLERGVRVDVFIVDNKSMRKPIEPANYATKRMLRVFNPAGTITKESWRIVGEAINSEGPTGVLVDGEEDLLTIVAVLLAPEGSLVMYGQPDEGAVIIRVDGGSKERMRKILERMEYK